MQNKKSECRENKQRKFIINISINTHLLIKINNLRSFLSKLSLFFITIYQLVFLVNIIYQLIIFTIFIIAINISNRIIFNSIPYV